MARSHTATRAVSWALSILGIAMSAAIMSLLPHFVGQSWAAIAASLSGLSAFALIALGLLWVAGLLAHTILLITAMPGLTVRRAMLLNLSGSAVSNLFPFGGAAGMGLGYVMTRAWRFPASSYASFTAISNVWNVLAKLLVGSTLLGTALLLGLRLPTGLNGVVASGTIGMFLAVLVVVGVVASTRMATFVGELADRAGALLTRTGRSRPLGVREWILLTREESASTVVAGWHRLTLGVLAYMVLQGVLLWACLMAVGAHAAVPAVLVTFGVERLLTVLPFTPGGSGLAELGSVGVLISMGTPPVPAAAGVLLYRLYTFLLTIPVGGGIALLWIRRHGRTMRREGAEQATCPPPTVLEVSSRQDRAVRS